MEPTQAKLGWGTPDWVNGIAWATRRFFSSQTRGAGVFFPAMKTSLLFLFAAVLATCAIAQTPDANAPTTPVRITENVHVTKMVDTPYPLRAEQEQIQGRVVLDVTV